MINYFNARCSTRTHTLKVSVLWYSILNRAAVSIIVCLKCRNGASCSGLLCAISYMVERLKVEQDVDVFQSVKHIRINRPQLIQTFVCTHFFHLDVLFVVWRIPSLSYVAKLTSDHWSKSDFPNPTDSLDYASVLNLKFVLKILKKFICVMKFRCRQIAVDGYKLVHHSTDCRNLQNIGIFQLPAFASSSWFSLVMLTKKISTISLAVAVLDLSNWRGSAPVFCGRKLD